MTERKQSIGSFKLVFRKYPWKHMVFTPAVVMRSRDARRVFLVFVYKIFVAISYVLAC